MGSLWHLLPHGHSLRSCLIHPPLCSSSLLAFFFLTRTQTKFQTFFSSTNKITYPYLANKTKQELFFFNFFLFLSLYLPALPCPSCPNLKPTLLLHSPHRTILLLIGKYCRRQENIRRLSELDSCIFYAICCSRDMGLLCSKNRHYTEADAEENAQAAEIERRIEQETKAEKHIQKLLLLGAGESGKSTIFKQIKLLFQTGFDEAELQSYISVIHANIYQTIKILYDGSKEFSQNDADSSKYVLSSENKVIGEKLSVIGSRLDYPQLNRELAQEIETLWKDSAIQETYARGNELQIPDCADYFMENLQRLSEANYIPTKEDVLYARVRTTGVVEIQFSPVGENKKSGEVYRLFDVGGQRNERRKWIHLFEGVTAVIFCAAISEYDQTLFEDEQKNRMMETKELFDWVLKQPCFEKTSFMLFLNKFDIFEKKVLKVPLNVCEWFKDYQPVSTGKQEIEHAYEFVKKKFEELYFQSTAPDRVDRVFKIYRTTALDQKLVKKTFKLVDETLRRRNLFEAGLL